MGSDLVRSPRIPHPETTKELVRDNAIPGTTTRGHTKFPNQLYLRSINGKKVGNSDHLHLVVMHSGGGQHQEPFSLSHFTEGKSKWHEQDEFMSGGSQIKI